MQLMAAAFSVVPRFDTIQIIKNGQVFAMICPVKVRKAHSHVGKVISAANISLSSQVTACAATVWSCLIHLKCQCALIEAVYTLDKILISTQRGLVSRTHTLLLRVTQNPFETSCPCLCCLLCCLPSRLCVLGCIV